MLENEVSNLVPMGIIEFLEMVDIEDGHGERRAVLVEPFGQGGDLVVKHTTIGQAGEGVGSGCRGLRRWSGVWFCR